MPDRDYGGNRMRRCLKLTVVIAVVALVAAITGSSAIGQTTTTTGRRRLPKYGPPTNGNAKAAKAVKGVPLTGTAGSGLTRGVTSSSLKVGCSLTQGRVV